MTIRCDHGSFIDIEEKAIKEGDDNWIITGYGSVFNNVDQGNDIVMPGAFRKSLETHGMPLLLFNHKMEDAPIGTVVEAKEDKRGLWFKAELPKSDSFVSGRIVPQLKNRGLKGTSIGYRATEKETRKSDGVRLLKQVRLWEISVVNLPMNQLAGVDTVKGLVSFHDHFIDRSVTSWDAKEVFERLQEKLAGDVDTMRACFLFADGDDVKSWDHRLLICDVDEKGRLATNPVALYKASALIAGARGGVTLPEDAEIAVKDTLDRYYSKLNLESPFKSLSADEFDDLDQGELEARLKGLGISRKLATRITDLRDADRKQVRRDAAPTEDAAKALTAVLLSSLLEAAAAIKP